MENSLLAFTLTLAAGLATAVGSLFCSSIKNTKFLAVSLGFSAGIMIVVSLAEILPEAHASLRGALGFRWGSLAAICVFLAGALFIGILDRVFPHENGENAFPCEYIPSQNDPRKSGLMRTGSLAAAAFAGHNFPEGLATFLAALHDLSVGIPLAISVGLHNIPAGIAISLPIYLASGRRGKAFAYALAAGLAGPFGAVCGYLFLQPFIDEIFSGLLFAFLAGIMIFISLDELLPAARKYGPRHLSIYGLLAGVALVWIGKFFLMG